MEERGGGEGGVCFWKMEKGGATVRFYKKVSRHANFLLIMLKSNVLGDRNYDDRRGLRCL